MNRRDFIACSQLALISPFFSRTSSAEATGELQIHSLRSSVFKNERKLRIWLPPGYDTSERVTYPVLYLNDGQNLFDAATSTFSDQEWQIDETAAALIQEGQVQPFIVVGIDHPGKKERPFEYLPWEDVFLSPPVPGPQGRRYPKFLLDEVLPFVESRYPVRNDPAGRVLGGSSYGGLIALYSVVTHPAEFGGLLAESPSFYVADARILELSRQVNDWPEKVYLGVGTHEGRSSCEEEENREAIEDVLTLERIIRSLDGEASVKVEIEPCGRHNENAYARRLPKALRFLFGN